VYDHANNKMILSLTTFYFLTSLVALLMSLAYTSIW